MKPSWRIWSTILIMVFVTLACGTLPVSTPTQDTNDAVATQVATTLTAVANEGVVPTSEPVAGTSPAPSMPPPPAVLRVAYVKNGNIWLWTEGDGTLQLTTTGNTKELALSDDGQVVVFLREPALFHPEVWAINTDGSNERMLLSSAELLATYTGSPADAPSGIGLYQMVMRPGSHTLYYSTRPLYEGPGNMGYYDLYFVNADTLEKVTLFGHNNGGVAYFSPDGLQIALSKPTSISLVNFDGSNLRRDVLTYGNVITYSEYLYQPKPVWASDSSGLRVVIPPADPMSTPLPPSTLWYIPTSGSPVFSGSILAIPFAWPDTAISPDLSRLAYAKTVGEPSANMRELHLANADATGDTTYMSGDSLRFIGWLPNSNQFVFIVSGSGSTTGTHVGTVGGGYTTLSTNPTLMGNITWPDETHFLYVWRSDPNWELRYNLLGGVGSTLIDTGEIWEYEFAR